MIPAGFLLLGFIVGWYLGRLHQGNLMIREYERRHGPLDD